MVHFVYILQSKKTGKYYCGETQDFAARLEYHNSGYSKYSKTGTPWELIKLVELLDRKAARRLENTIKKIGIGRWLNRQTG